MPTWIPVLVTISIFLSGGALGFAFRMVRDVTALKTECKVLSCIPDLKAKVATLAQNDEVFWKVIGPHMSGIIASPTHVNRDHLINGLDEGTLTYDQALSLNSLLGHALQEERDNTRRVALAFKLAQVRCLLNAMDRERKPLEEVTACPPMPSSPTR
jgi:hypothetical protein